MAQLGMTFDANQVEPNAPFEVLPPGDYQAQIIQSEMRATKNGEGQYLWLELDVIAGPQTGRKIFDRLNLVNANTQAVEIAQRTLSAICHATGKLTVSDSEELHFRPLIASVKVRPAGPDATGVQRDAQNEVKGYKPLSGQTGAAAAQTQAPATTAPARPQQAAALSGQPPWRRSA